MRLKIGFSRPRLNRQQFALSEEKQEDEWGCTFSIEQFAKLALSDKNDISQLWWCWGGNSGLPRAHRCPALPRCLHTHPLWHCCPCQVIRLEVFQIRRWGGILLLEFSFPFVCPHFLHASYIVVTHTMRSSSFVYDAIIIIMMTIIIIMMTIIIICVRCDHHHDDNHHHLCMMRWP